MKPKPRRRGVGFSASDRAFDRLVPDELRHLSQAHWTPIEVAIRATTLLCPTKDMRILDVGAGVGKLCVVGALSSVGMWCGVEQQAPLVHAARRLACALGVTERTIFLHGDALAIDWREFDAIYLYNPFENPVTADHGHTDYRRQVADAQDRLASLPEGARVVTFHGFGGVMPSSYELVYQERMPTVGLDLVLWVQRTKARPPC